MNGTSDPDHEQACTLGKSEPKAGEENLGSAASGDTSTIFLQEYVALAEYYADDCHDYDELLLPPSEQ